MSFLPTETDETYDGDDSASDDEGT